MAMTLTPLTPPCNHQNMIVYPFNDVWQIGDPGISPSSKNTECDAGINNFVQLKKRQIIVSDQTIFFLLKRDNLFVKPFFHGPRNDILHQSNLTIIMS